ncbi:MAG: addiction module toxin RelE [Gammaproteobacteria bacterium]|nr:addiction module toxin RelE [Gammaproteobacteria bacterium]
MTRPLRIEFEGGLYHINSRGDRREDIYRTDADSEVFMTVLEATCDRFNWVIYAYCLMSNHYHLLVETLEGNLSKGMRHLNGVYSQTFNRAHQLVGHVFQGRYKGIVVEKESYLLELCRYIVLNPVRAGMAREVGDWQWSSYRGTVGLQEKQKFVDTRFVLSQFGSTTEGAITRYIEFVYSGLDISSPWGGMKNQIYLGSEEFVDCVQSKIELGVHIDEVPRLQRRPVPKSLVWYSNEAADRNDAILNAYASGGYSMREIGAFFHLKTSTVSGIINNRKSKT